LERWRSLYRAALREYEEQLKLAIDTRAPAAARRRLRPCGVFVDGPVHDGVYRRERDAAAEERLIDLGWSVIRIRYDEDWEAVVARHRSVFGGAV